MMHPVFSTLNGELVCEAQTGLDHFLNRVEREAGKDTVVRTRVILTRDELLIIVREALASRFISKADI